MVGSPDDPVRLSPFQRIVRFTSTSSAEYVSFSISIVGQRDANYYERTVDTGSPSDLICTIPEPDTQDKYLVDSVSDYALHLVYNNASFLRYVDGEWMGLSSEHMSIQGSLKSSESGEHFVHEVTYPEWYGTFDRPNVLVRAHFTPVSTGSTGIPVPFNPDLFFNNAVTDQFCAQVGFLGNPGTESENFVCRDTAGIPYMTWLPAIGNIYTHVVGAQADIRSLFSCKVNSVTWPVAGLATVPDIREPFDSIDAPRSLIVLCRRPAS